MSSDFIFIDLETTGLVPSEGHILELGMAVYDYKLDLKSKFHSLVCTPEFMEYERSGEWIAQPFAYDMHEESGLNAELLCLGKDAYMPGGLCHIKTVFLDAVKWLNASNADYINEPLCGNSLGFDRAWLAHHVPWFNDLFSYRNIDCSGMLEYVKKVDPEKAKLIEAGRMQKGGHRVLGDIQDSVNLLKSLRYNGAIL